MTFLHVYKLIKANEFEVLIEKIFTIWLKNILKENEKKNARLTIILQIIYNIINTLNFDILFQFDITLEEKDLKFT